MCSRCCSRGEHNHSATGARRFVVLFITQRDSLSSARVTRAFQTAGTASRLPLEVDVASECPPLLLVLRFDRRGFERSPLAFKRGEPLAVAAVLLIAANDSRTALLGLLFKPTLLAPLALFFFPQPANGPIGHSIESLVL